MQAAVKTILALDVGAKRIGVAVATTLARLAQPLTTLDHTETVIDVIAKLCDEKDVEAIVVGLPRGMRGQDTEQTKITAGFITELKAKVTVPLYVQDEAVTSRQAEAELNARGKAYKKGAIDALAATYILEDWLHDHPEAA